MDIVFEDENLLGLIFCYLKGRDAINFSFSFKKAKSACKEDCVIKFVHKIAERETFSMHHFKMRNELDIEFFKRYLSQGKTFRILKGAIAYNEVDNILLDRLFEEKLIFENNKNLVCCGTIVKICLCIVELSHLEVFQNRGVILESSCGACHNREMKDYKMHLVYELYKKNCHRQQE